MYVSGNNFRLTPGVRFYSFELNNVNLSNHTGVAEIGFSGSGKMKSFSFSDGKVYDFDNRYVYNLASGERINISGDVATGKYTYYINGVKTYQSNHADQSLQKVFFNTTGSYLNFVPKLRASLDLSAYDIQIETGFYAGDSVTGDFINNSDIDIYAYSSRFEYKDSDKAAFSGVISGEVNAQSSLNFTLQDLQSQRADTSVEFDLYVDTSIGTLTKGFNLSRLSNLTGDLHLISLSAFEGGTIDIPLTGSGLVNEFVYDRQPSGVDVQTIQYSRHNNTGEEKEKTLFWHIQPNNFTGAQTGTGTFITGYSFTNVGFYSGTQAPSATFLSYNEVVDVNFNPNNLFSPGCADSLPVSFNTASGLGVGATGTAYLKDVVISLYGSTQFKTITGFDMVGLGTGYNYPPFPSIVTGGNCFDVPFESGNSYVYTPFTGSGVLRPQAGYLHGIPLTGTGTANISGVPYTGQAVTGFQITNIGSGWNTGSGFIPKVIYHRSADDGFPNLVGMDASGVFSFNTSGDSYDFDSNWTFRTGSSFSSLINIYTGTALGGGLGYSGSINLKKNEDIVYFYSYYQQTSLDIEPEVAISFFADQPTGSSVIITGRNYTNDGTGMLYSVPAEINTGIFIEF